MTQEDTLKNQKWLLFSFFFYITSLPWMKSLVRGPLSPSLSALSEHDGKGSWLTTSEDLHRCQRSYDSLNGISCVLWFLLNEFWWSATLSQEWSQGLGIRCRTRGGSLCCQGASVDRERKANLVPRDTLNSRKMEVVSGWGTREGLIPPSLVAHEIASQRK